MKPLPRMMALALVLLASAGHADEPKKAPLDPGIAPKKMTLPEGFTATTFAAEPDVVQPIAFTIDTKGRLWVAENTSYPTWLGGPQGKDRILIFEDTDGDGKHDKRTVFWDKGNNVTGLALGFGGVWVCATPNLLFIPDKDGDDVPDGPPVVKLDGWDTKAQHNMFNALNWAPDGWLWGCNGILSNSRVGKPGTKDSERVPINCGVWRYHPTRETFEVVANGTTNPWGLDFDEYGEAFITNCVIPHLFHVVPGARFQRMFGQDFNAHSYDLLKSCADHVHWDTVQVWSDIRTVGVTPITDRAGGGHAHAGAMIYLGDNWPDEYRNNLFTCNIHGHRVNRDLLERKGSGYVAKHGKDFLLANDDWFRGLEMKYGPDGAVYLTDWSDIGECHETDSDNAHRENGRIYKIAYGKPSPVKVDLERMSDAELLNLLTHKNEWYGRTARRLLQERQKPGAGGREMAEQLRKRIASDGPTTARLRYLWAANAMGVLEAIEDADAGWLREKDETVLAWKIRLLFDRAPRPKYLDRLVEIAKSGTSPRVRLALASALQKLDLTDRWTLAEALLAHGEDAGDAMIPLMLWYGVEPIVPVRSRVGELLDSCKIPLLRRYIARRTVEADDVPDTAPIGRGSLAGRVASTEHSAERLDILAGMLDAFRGRKRVAAPQGWAETSAILEKSPDAEVRLRAVLLSLHFGEPRAGDALRTIVEDKAAPEAVRKTALQALVEAKVPGLAERLRAMLDDSILRGAALRALASVPDEATPKAILTRYKALSPEERDDAINTLASRAEFADAMLNAVAEGSIPARDLSVTTARQIQALNKPALNEKLERVWGTSRPTSREKVALMAKYKALVGPESLKSADSARGRSVFERTCAQCHKLYDKGGDVGPDLTGSDRANVDYVLENVLDPSATVAREYRLNTLATADGRVISGILREQNEKTVTVQTVNERLVLPRDEIEGFKESPVSMMPEGLLEKLSPEEFRDLIAYLASKAQVAPAPATPAR